MAASVVDQFTKDALLIIWDILGDLNVDDNTMVTQKRDQLKKLINAIEVPKATARKARRAVDAIPPDVAP